MNARFLRGLLPLLWIGLFSACGELRFERQELSAHYDVGADVLTLELVYHDVSAVKERSYEWVEGEFRRDANAGPDVALGEKTLAELAAGKRRFMLFDPILDFRLDRDSGGASEPDAFERRMLRFADGVGIEEACVYLDEAGHLGVHQSIRVRDFSLGLELCNESLRRDFLSQLEKGAFEETDLPLDRATLDQALADVEAGFDWVRWTDAGPALVLPASPALVARALTLGFAQLGDVKEAERARLVRMFGALGRLLAPLDRVEVRDGHVHLALRLDAEGWLRLDVPAGSGDGSTDYDPALAEHLAARGWTLPSVWKSGR